MMGMRKSMRYLSSRRVGCRSLGSEQVGVGDIGPVDWLIQVMIEMRSINKNVSKIHLVKGCCVRSKYPNDSV